MRVRDLVALLKAQDPNATVVINRQIVTGLETQVGRLRDGHLHLTPAGKARDHAITFTHLIEHSDGTMLPSPIWQIPWTPGS